MPRADAPRGTGGRLAVAAAALAAGTLALAAAAPAPAAAQGPQEIDAGTFELRVRGRTVGTESFGIRRRGGDVRAVGRVRIDSSAAGLRAREVWLQTDGEYVPSLFRVRPATGDVQSVTAVREENRLRVQISSAAGDRWKEFLAPPDLTLIEPGVAHHWTLILRQHGQALEREGRVAAPAVLPVEARRSTLVIQRRGTRQVEVPGANRSAVLYTATLDGGDETRVWIDEEGRVLRMEIPARNLAAVRLPGK